MQTNFSPAHAGPPNRICTKRPPIVVQSTVQRGSAFRNTIQRNIISRANALEMLS